MKQPSPPVQASLAPPLTDFSYRLACRDNLAFIAETFPAESVHLILTSPPYNLGKSYERRRSLSVYLEAQERILTACAKILRAGGSLCWQVGNWVDEGEVVPLDAVLYPLFKKLGFRLRNRVVWHFEHGLHCSKRLSGRYETINWFTKGDAYTFHLDPIRMPSKYPQKRHYKGPKRGQLSGNPLGKNPGDVWCFPNVKHNHVEKTIHPCQFPVELAERLVLALTSPGDSVFDPYMGVGSTLIAALKHGRAAYGCDIVPEYVSIAEQRIAALGEGTLRTRPMHKPVYDPTQKNGGH